MGIRAVAVFASVFPRHFDDSCVAMQFHYVSLLALAAAPVLGLPRGNVTACKATPGDAGWPSPEAWAQLNETTGGHLLRPTPPGAVCHPTQPVFAEDQCSKIQSSWFDEFFHADDPVSVEWNNWNNDTCLANSNFPCSTTGYPVYVVNATTPQHVKAGVDFGEQCFFNFLILLLPFYSADSTSS